MSSSPQPIASTWHEPADFVQHLERLAHERARDTALTVVRAEQGETLETRLDYQDFARRARAIATMLQRHFQPGDRVLIMMDNDEHYATSMFGCFYSGVIAVPVFPPESMRPQHLARLESIARDAAADGVLTVATLMPLVSEGAGHFGIDTVLAVDTIDPGEADRWQARHPAMEDIAFLQYTSGSTGDPKGVMVTHGNLMANERAIRAVLSIGPEDSFGVWAPLFHDMGLIGGLLQPIYSGIPCVLASPRFFLENPLRWLQMISRHRVSLSGGPDFAFRLCLDRIRESQCAGLDLSSWRLAYTGAEPVRNDTMEAFIERFSPVGFRAKAVYPCYGLAEATLLVTGGRRGSGMTAVGFDGQALARREVRTKADGIMQVGCGTIAPGHQLRLADPEANGWLPPNRIGEIWVAGPSVAAGYWNNPEATAATFVKRDGQRWLRTGDLGFLYEGDLYISGRLKDMIIVRGHNIFPQDIERVVEEEVEAVRKGRSAAFAVEVDGREGIGVAAEISRGLQKLIPPQALIEAIRIAVSEAFGESPSTVVLLNPGALPKTSSGKVQRSACQQGWLAGSLDAYASEEAGRLRLTGEAPRPDGPDGPAPDDDGPKGGAGNEPKNGDGHDKESSADRQKLTTLWNEALRRPDDAVYRDDAHFLAEGGNSLAAAQLAARMAEAWQIDVSLRAIAETPRFGQQLALIRQEKSSGGKYSGFSIPLLDEASRHQPQPLTPAQKQQWFLWRMNPSSSAYHIQGALRLDGVIDASLLEQALNLLASRHPILQTVFRDSPDGEVTQQVQAGAMPVLETHDVSPLPMDDREARARQILHERNLEPFDLEKGPLLRVVLIRLSAQAQVLGIIMHHIISDGSSMQILLDELGDTHAGLSSGQASSRTAQPDTRVTYLDHAAWQTSPEAQAGLADEARYWEEQLKVAEGEPQPVLMLPADHPRPSVAAYRAGQVTRALPERLRRSLDALAQRLGCSRFVLMLAAFQALLHRYSGQEDIRVGVPVANRPGLAVNRTVGLFVNSVVMRARLDGRQSWEALIGQVQDTVLAAQEHQRFPFDQLVERLAPERNLAHSPLFQVMFNLLGQDFRKLGEALNVQVQAMPLVPEHAQFELSLDIIEEAGGPTRLCFTHARELFEAATIERMAGHYLTLLQAMTGNPAEPHGQAPLMSAAELDSLAAWGVNPTESEEPALPVHALFEAQAGQEPHREALIFGDQTLSYQASNQRANQLAHHLRHLGVGPEVRVGIAVERSIGMVVGLLAILKAGGAYVPLDPDYPAERLRYMIEDSGIGLLLTQTSVLRKLPELGLETVPVPSIRPAGNHGAPNGAGAPPLQVLDLDAVDVSRYPVLNPEVAVHGENLAYLIYTSGSTGRPKGTAIRHQALSRCMQWMQQKYQLGSEDTVLHKAPFCFDVSVWEIFWPLTAGVRLVVASPGEHRDPARITELIRRHQVTTLNFVPAMLQAFLAHEGIERETRLRYVICGGEAMPAATQREALQRLDGVSLQNLYGPTETTIHVTQWQCRDDGKALVPIGRPISATSAHVLDEMLQPVPAGVAGELYIGGDLLARGYLGRQALSAERFVANPFSSEGKRLYRTGDLVRWNAEGQLEYLGRIDHQVKIRGFRIELGEVEAQLLAQPEVREAVVVADEGPGGARLVAYVSAHVDSLIDVSIVRERLAASLPDYMVPSAIMVLDALPLNSNGKVNRKALPMPRLECAEHVPPEGVVETFIAETWSQVMGLENPGRFENFFELGGNSLLVMRIQSLIQNQYDIELETRDFFTHTTIVELAKLIEMKVVESILTMD